MWWDMFRSSSRITKSKMNKCHGIPLPIFASLKARDLYEHIVFKGQWSQCNMEGCKAKLELLARAHVHYSVCYPDQWSKIICLTAQPHYSILVKSTSALRRWQINSHPIGCILCNNFVESHYVTVLQYATTRIPHNTSYPERKEDQKLHESNSERTTAIVFLPEKCMYLC